MMRKTLDNRRLRGQQSRTVQPWVRGLLVVASVALSAACSGLAFAGNLEVLVLDRDGKPMPDAVVIVQPSGKGTRKTPLPLSAEVNQEKLQFVPNVTVVGVGAKVRFTNSDPWNHHVRFGVAGAALGSTEGQSVLLEGKSDTKPGGSAVFTLSTPGPTGAALLGCFIHSRMQGTVYVADSPWTVKTGANGVAVLEDVPEGAATVRVWHAAQLVEKPPLQLNVQGAAGKATFQLDVAPRRRG
jgi:plastocyanin